MLKFRISYIHKIDFMSNFSTSITRHPLSPFSLCYFIQYICSECTVVKTERHANVVLMSQLLHNTLRIPSEFYHLRGLRKDTNCRSELKPVFIYTGIHMFISCGIIFERVFWTKETSAFMHRKAVQYDSLVIPAIRT